MAAVDGINRQIDPINEGFGPYDCNLYTLDKIELSKVKGLPTNLQEATKAIEQDHKFLTDTGVMSKKLIQVQNNRLLKEHNQINVLPHPAEFRLYYNL